MVGTVGMPVAEMPSRCQTDETTLYPHVMIKRFIFIYEDNLCRRCLGTLNDKKEHFLLFKLAITKHKKGKTDNRAGTFQEMSNEKQKKKTRGRRGRQLRIKIAEATR